MEPIETIERPYRPLIAFADDIIALLCEYLQPTQIWALLSTGDRLLAVKLLKNMSLHSLEVNSANLTVLGELERLTGFKRLRRLKVPRTVASLCSLLNSFPALRIQLPYLRCVVLEDIRYTPDREMGRLDFEENVKEIVKLGENTSLDVLQCQSSAWSPLCRLGLDEFAFPSTLTSLELYKAAYFDFLDHPDFAFPPQLTQLHWVPSPPIDEEICRKLLPKSLTSLQLQFSFTEQANITTWALMDYVHDVQDYAITPQDIRLFLDDENANLEEFPRRKEAKRVLGVLRKMSKYYAERQKEATKAGEDGEPNILDDIIATFGQENEPFTAEEMTLIKLKLSRIRKGEKPSDSTKLSAKSMYAMRNASFGSLRHLSKLRNLQVEGGPQFSSVWDLLSLPSTLTSLTMQSEFPISSNHTEYDDNDFPSIAEDLTKYKEHRRATFVRDCLPPLLQKIGGKILGTGNMPKPPPHSAWDLSSVPQTITSAVFPLNHLTVAAESAEDFARAKKYFYILAKPNLAHNLPDQTIRDGFAGIHTIQMDLNSTVLPMSMIAALPDTLTTLKANIDIEEVSGIAYRFPSMVAKNRRNLLKLSYNLISAAETGIPSHASDYQGYTSHSLPDKSERSPKTSVENGKRNEREFWPPLLSTFKILRANLQLLDMLPTSITHFNAVELDVDHDAIAEMFYSPAAERLLREFTIPSLNKSIRTHFGIFEGREVERLLFNFSSAKVFPFLYQHTERISLRLFTSLSADHFEHFQRLNTITDEGGTLANLYEAEEQNKLVTPQSKGAPRPFPRDGYGEDINHTGRPGINGMQWSDLVEWLPECVTRIQTSHRTKVDDSILIRAPETITRLETSQLVRSLGLVAHTFTWGAYGHELNEQTLKKSSDDFLREVIASGRFKVDYYATLDRTPIMCTPDIVPSLLPMVITSIVLKTDTSDAYFYSILPPLLTKLNIGTASHISDECFSTLPSTLQSLEIGKIGEDCDVSDAAFSMIPNSITSLSMPQHKNFTDRCFAGFAHRTALTTLRTRIESIDDSSILELPVDLTYLDIPGTNLSEASLATFPRGLTYLAIVEAHSLSNASPAALPPGLVHFFGPEPLTSKCTVELFPNIQNGLWGDLPHADASSSLSSYQTYWRY